MDLFTLMMAIILIMLALTTGQTWILFGTIILVSLGTKSIPTTIVMSIGAVVLFYSRDVFGDYWHVALFGLLILALILGFKADEGGQGGGGEYYSPDAGGLMGGGGMGGGVGGF